MQNILIVLWLILVIVLIISIALEIGAIWRARKHGNKFSCVYIMVIIGIYLGINIVIMISKLY